MTCRTFIRVYRPSAYFYTIEGSIVLTFKYSTNRFKKATKCSALRMFPGTASFNRSSGSTAASSAYTPYGNSTGPTRIGHERILGFSPIIFLP